MKLASVEPQQHFFGTLFLFILAANFFGLIPGMEPPTGDSDLTFGLGAICFVYYIYQGRSHAPRTRWVPDERISLRSIGEVLVEWVDGFVRDVTEAHHWAAVGPVIKLASVHAEDFKTRVAQHDREKQLPI
jgi:F0F1-type ATP synthase membrane subunit a